MSWLSGFKYRVKLTIDSTKFGSDVSWFPLAVHLSSSCGLTNFDVTDIFDKLGEHKKKIAVTKSDGLTRLYVDVEKWDATNKDAWLIVGVPDISSTTDTVLYLYYDPDVEDQDWHPDVTQLGDNFTGSDGDDPDLMKWRILRGSPSIQSNHLSVSVSSSNTHEWVAYKHMLWGDFDIQVTCHVDSTPATNWWVMALVLHFPDRSNHWCYVGRGYDSTIGQQFIRSRYNKGSSTTLDWDNVTATDFTLRLVREGATIKFYYKTTGSWVQLSSITMYADSAVVTLEHSCGGSYPSVSGYYDDFTVASTERATGYVGRAGQYAASGVWDNDFLLATSMIDSFDLQEFLTKSSNYGNQGLVADGTHFYWGKNNGTGVNGTIYKFTYDGTDVDSFTGPPHCAGGDIHEDNGTLLFCSGGSESYEIWEITKGGLKVQEWDLSSVDYGEGGLIAYKSGNVVYAFTSDTSTSDFKIREVTLHSNGTYTLGDVWSSSSLGTPQGLDYVNGRLLFCADHDSQVSIYELLLRDDGTIDAVEYKTGITDEGEGLAWDGDYFYFGTYNDHKIYRVEDLVDIHSMKLKPSYIRDEVHVGERKLLTKKGSGEPQAVSTDFAGGQSFDGSDDYISIGNDAGYLDFLGTEDFTIEALAKTSDSGWGVIYAARHSGTTPLVHFRKNDSNQLELWKQDDGGDDIHPISTTAIADGSYHHLVGVLEGTTGKLYIDGSADDTDSNTSCGDADLSSIGQVIGRKYDTTTGDEWDGEIALIRVSRTARSQDWLQASRYSLLDSAITLSNLEHWYLKYMKFVIDHTKIDSDLTHFPITMILTKDNANAVFTELGSNYKKIAVTESDKTSQLYVEVEQWDATNNKAVLHVSRSGWTISSSVDTVIYLHYDAGTEDNTDYVGDPGDSVAQNVWDSNFKSVWHLCQDPTGGTGCIKDSTGNNNDGTPQGSMTSGDLVDGKVGKALDFDGSDDYVSVPDSTSLRPQNMTLEALIKSDVLLSSKDFPIMLNKQNWTIKSGYLLGQYSESDGSLGIRILDGTSSYEVKYSEPNYNEWMHIVGVYDGQYLRIFKNDEEKNTNNIGSVTVAHDTTSLKISNSVFDGLIDEVRISNTARSSAWIKATYYSLFGTLVQRVEEPGWLYGYDNRIKFIVSNAKIDSDLTHFPITIFLTEGNAADVFSEIGSNYKKIAVTTEDGLTQLYVEVEKWDSTNKQAVLHVSRSLWMVFSSKDTSVYLYYDADVDDNTTYVGDPGDTVAANVWDSNFQCVWHLSQDPTGGSGCIKDSTSNDRDLTPQGSMTVGDLVDGKVGKALDFDGSDDYLRGSDWFYSNVLTLEAVFKVDTTSNDNRLCLKRNIGTTGNANEWEFWVSGTSLAFAGWGSSGAVFSVTTSSGLIGIDTWYYSAGKCNGSNAYVFINDEQKGLGSQTGSVQDTNSEIQVACRSSNDSTRYMNGLIDEVRISNTARSDAWIKATYYSLFGLLVQREEEEENALFFAFCF